MHKQSLIEKIRDKDLDTDHNDHIAQITGVRQVPVPAFYRHIETGQEFYAISGALAWPSADSAGFAVIVGVKKGDDPQEPAFEALAEVESPSVEGLLKASCAIRGKWGYPEVLDVWQADTERFSTVVVDFNHNLKRSDAMLLSDPYDFQRPNHSEIYLQRILELVGDRRLRLGGCSRLKGCLRDLPHDAAQAGQIEQWPAAAALGYVVHTLLVLKPWLRFVKQQRLVSTMGEDGDNFYDLPYYEQREVMRLLDPASEDEWPEDDGRLIHTIR
jgi:hypothetical protein